MADDETVAGRPSGGARRGLAEADAIAGRYRVVRWLGGGGMGNVYEAIDTELGETVALKVLGGDLTEAAIERFRREVRLTRRIRHENVARMFDIGEHQGSRFLTMELIDGAPLSRELGTPMPWVRLQAISQQIAAGLAAAHAEGVIHRDLKPDNVLVERTTERAVVTDFGIARSQDDVAVTQIGQVIGTPRYMSPEQLTGDPADGRSDLFSLGVMLFELATATRPWPGKTIAEIAVARATTPPRPFARPDCPPAFAELLESCLSIAPGERPASADELGLAIAACEVGGTTQIDLRPAPEDAPRRDVPRRTRISSPEIPTQPGADGPSTIAVMPFTAATEDAYLADGMVEDLIDTLSTTAMLRVRPIGASGRDEPDARALGRRLGVDHVVSGSVRRVPSGLRVTARLTSVADGFQIWARRTDTIEAGVLTLADELASEIARAMSTQATAREKPTDPHAVELYLRARAELRLFFGTHIVAAADLLERAAELAPTSPAILGAFSFAAAHAWVMSGGAAHAERARAAVARGMALGHGDASLASSILRTNLGDAEGGASDLAIAIARAPMSAHAHETVGTMLNELGHVAAARLHLETSVGLDPGRGLFAAVELSRMEALQGHWTHAFARLAPLAASPQLPIAQVAEMNLLRMHGWRRDLPAMVAATTRLTPPANETSTMILALVRDALGHQRLDIAEWTRLAQLFGAPGRPLRRVLLGYQLLAEFASLFDQSDLAFDALHRAASAGLVDVAWLEHCPLIGGLAPDRLRPIRDQAAAQAGRVLRAFRGAGTP